MEKYDNIVFIGRFQPLHNGHLNTIKKALLLANKRVIILVGSVNGPRTFKNPFTFKQRQKIICETIKFEDDIKHNWEKSYHVFPIKDHPYNDSVWINSVQEQVANIIGTNETVAIIGSHKDKSSKYLDWFPQWGYVSEELDKDSSVIDATAVRNILFEDLNVGFFKGVLPNESFNFLQEFKNTAEYSRIRDEYEVIKAYKKSWESAPYAPTFVCTDAVVLCAGHVLMIERGAQPGKGQWALPGGFLNPDERIRACAVRELIEETKIDVPERVLDGSIDKVEVFDHPNRSQRGRTITHAFRINVNLTPKGKLPKVKGSDDAAKAKWIPLNELNEDLIYEDHFSIITSMIGN